MAGRNDDETHYNIVDQYGAMSLPSSKDTILGRLIWNGTIDTYKTICRAVFVIFLNRVGDQ